MKVNVKIKRLNDAAVIPQYAHEYDAGFDLVATSDVIVEPGETVKVPTGLAFELPPGYEMQIRPRSGISAKTKLRVVLGTIDSTYRGEVGVIVDNIAQTVPTVQDGEIFDEATFITYDMFGNEYELSDEMADDVLPVLKNTIVIPKGTRIAQAVINRVESAHFQEVAQLSETTRGTGGFGSSGVKS